jgi:flagellar motor switch protein FliN/FliY
MNDTPLLTHFEIDTIGEILNISMGAAATAVSVLLNKQVSITTPVVQVVKQNDFEYSNLEPVVGVEINYIDGLHGSNLMIMNISDVKAIVASLLGVDSADTDYELDEIHTSALGEIMNQMMGSASTALATFFRKPINISPPLIVEPTEFFDKFFSSENNIVSVAFRFIVDGLVDNEFITVFPIDFTKELVYNAMNMSDSEESVNADNEEYIDTITGHRQIPDISMEDETSRSRASAQNRAVSTPKPTSKPKPRKNVSVKNVEFENFDETDSYHQSDDYRNPDPSNLDLLMDVALNISVEIGSTKKAVKDVVNLSKGSIIELDKRAGDPVDIIVNGQLFARGDVVVIDDNFGVRITEVINSK